MGITVSILFLALPYIAYKIFFEDGNVDFRDKIFHYMATFYFWISGANLKHKLNRSVAKVFDAYPKPGEKDGILTRDFTIPHYKEKGRTVPVRIYETPNQIEDTLMIWIHGGGFVMGLQNNYEETCRYFCSKGMSVLSIDYSLAPENPFPAGVDDCFSVLHWVKSNIANQKIVIAGDSAGGNLSAVMCLMNRDQCLELPIALQILIYPSFFLTVSDKKDYWVLSGSVRDFFTTAYLKNQEDINNELVNPMNSKLGLTNLPKCILISTEYDVLNHDANVWEKKFKQDGGDIVRLHYPTVHGFFCISFLKYTSECRECVVKEIQDSKYVGTAIPEQVFEAI